MSRSVRSLKYITVVGETDRRIRVTCVNRSKLRQALKEAYTLSFNNNLKTVDISFLSPGLKRFEVSVNPKRDITTIMANRNIQEILTAEVR